MTSSTDDSIVDAVCVVGGLLIAVSIPPQIYRVYKRQSALDISATRQVITIAGVFFQIVYLWYYEKWAAVVPLSIELCFLLCLLGLKFRLEYNPKGAALGDGQD